MDQKSMDLKCVSAKKMKPIKYVYIKEGNERMTDDDEFSDDDNNYNNAIVSDDEMNEYGENDDEEKVEDEDDNDDNDQDRIDDDDDEDVENVIDAPLTVDDFRCLLDEIASTRSDRWTSIRRHQCVQRLSNSFDPKQLEPTNNSYQNLFKVLINWKGMFTYSNFRSKSHRISVKTLYFIS
jgi:hypothetical protein